MTLDGEYEMRGKGDVFLVVERDSGAVVGAFYGVTGSPGWWRGHCFGRVRRLFLPGLDALEVAGRFMSRQ